MKIAESERLVLREMTPDDVDRLLVIFSDPVAMEHYPSIKTKEETKEWINWTLGNYKEYGVGLWIVERKDGTFVGQCGIVPQTVDGTTQFEIGYLFVREHWRKGYATEAAGACKKYGLEEKGYEKLISLIAPENIASKKVALNIGMSFEKEIQKWDRKIEVYSVSIG
ncbi:GNAT family N-acetyltransferase [Pseudalkalibacillus caeni]|uniref:GNAT family N-acetyltransferase n=1 Tax=Exobacillus caeni TaxID=2574798 RepID=A0A5R9FC91_9BACL|nr:GNAT family N-acetyltransferase [Pseudalkalibacillus caeni]TLS37275.1 GNAT family N-acetyltransferase [Pseudalkalibacillus caeni]